MLRSIKNRKAYLIKTALYGCLRHLNDGTDQYKPMGVCLAVSRWRDDNLTKFRVEAAIAVRKYIESLLEGHPFIHDWLWAKHGIMPTTTKQIQAYRKAWVQHMIKQMTQWEKEDP